MMNIFVLFVLTISCDVTMQLCFKYATRQPQRWPLISPFIWLGLVIGIIDMVIWLLILETVPLSIAYPIISLNYCGVVIGSQLVLGETITPRRWYGVVLITLGVAIVGTTEL
jgi:undecaprenyl phosphate-alpha-L-ara4N flippase subunit ArnE